MCGSAIPRVMSKHPGPQPSPITDNQPLRLLSKKEERWKKPKPKTETPTPTPERKMGEREKDREKERGEASASFPIRQNTRATIVPGQSSQIVSSAYWMGALRELINVRLTSRSDLMRSSGSLFGFVCAENRKQVTHVVVTSHLRPEPKRSATEEPACLLA